MHSAAEGAKYQKQWAIYQGRLKRFISHTYMAEMNITSCLVRRREARGIHIAQWSPHYDGPTGGRATFEEAKRAEYQSTTVGAKFGPSWSTHWFKVTIQEEQIPFSLQGSNVYFYWKAQGESLVWTADGQALHGLSPTDRTRFPYRLVRQGDACNGDLLFYIEMACNGLFGNGKGDLIAPPDENKHFALEGCEVREYDPVALRLFHDLEIIQGMVETWGEGDARGKRALFMANKIINQFRINQEGQANIAECQVIADECLRRPSPTKDMVVTAVGNCHIDTAWLWGYAETRRKTARSWSSQLALIDQHPHYIFVASQMQQLAWLKKDYPDLFSTLQKAYKKGNFLPVGGSWVEMDGNIPSGESFVRQFMYGQAFVSKNFGGLLNDIFWLPGIMLRS